jgi:PAS domain S-box-containing protein
MSRPAPDENRRLERLHELRIVDTAPEPSFDAAVSLAARLTECPLALLGFMDRDRHWFKAILGTQIQEVPRDLALCNHTMHDEGMSVVDDLGVDPRFAGHPFVVDALRLRFFASLPLRVEGEVVATLCVYDLRPRELSEPARQGLQQVGLMLESLLLARLKEQRSRLQEARVRTASLAGNDWLWESDREGRITWVSAGIEKHTGLRPQDEIGLLARDLFRPSADPEHRDGHAAYLKARAAQAAFSQLVMERDTPRGRLSVSVAGVPVFDSAGQFRGYRGATRVVTEELRIRQRARQAQTLLQDAIDSVGASIVITDAEDCIVHANRSWHAGPGRHLCDPQGMAWRDAVRQGVQAGDYPDAAGQEDSYLAWLTAPQPAGAAPRELRWRDRRIMVTEEAIAGGGTVRVGMDITEHSVAADRLRLSEELYRSVALSISDGLMVLTRDRYVVAVNPAACRILDTPMDTLMMRPGLDLLREDLSPLAAEDHPVHRALEAGESVAEQVFALRMADGQPRWLGVSAQPLRLAPGERPMSAVITFRDITRQRQAEQALAQSEQRWKFALEGSGDGVWDWDARSNEVYYSHSWRANLGHAHDTLSSHPREWAQRIHPEDWPRVRRALVAHLKGQTEDYQSEHRMRHRDGHYLWVFERGKAMSRSPDGRALRLVGTYSDITRLKQAEQALRDKQAAELASQAKTEFLSRMSHEIRTPLNAMIGFAQLLGMSANRADPVQVRDYAGHMLQAGRHLLALINDVLDLQRVEAGQLAFTPETLHLGTVVAEALELLAPMALQASVSIDNRIEAHWNVRADAQRTRQVLINLVSNAIKYNRSPGRVVLRCGVAAGQHLRLDIEDTGTGLDASQLDRLFQPFERLGRETSSVEGTGLGLLIAKRLVEEMGGRIAVGSTPGVGTTVSIELPRDDAGRALLGGAPGTVVAPALVARQSDGGVLRMLYVEDNPINALLFEEAMKLCSHVELRVAEDGPQAYSLVQGWRPDILVLDAHLPGKSGFEVLEDLRHHHGLHETPAFMCSADAMPDDIERARAAGFVGYWTKPISLDKVLADVERVAPRPLADA